MIYFVEGKLWKNKMDKQRKRIQRKHDAEFLDAKEERELICEKQRDHIDRKHPEVQTVEDLDALHLRWKTDVSLLLAQFENQISELDVWVAFFKADEDVATACLILAEDPDLLNAEKAD